MRSQLKAVRERATQNMGTISKEFLKQLNDWAAAEADYGARWNPDESPLIVGEVLNVEDVETQNGTGWKCTLRDEGPDALGEISFFLNSVLQSQFNQKKVDVGSIVAIKYFGEVESKTGRMYKNYGVRVQGSPVAPTTRPARRSAPDDADPFAGE